MQVLVERGGGLERVQTPSPFSIPPHPILEDLAGVPGNVGEDQQACLKVHIALHRALFMTEGLPSRIYQVVP
jgi:hypothetical protein